jgi:Dyp-type peroxidase family
MAISPILPTLDLTSSRVDPENPVFEPMLRDLQANILRSHGRAFSYYLFLRLGPARIAVAKGWMRGFAARLTSALELEAGRRNFKATGADGGAVFTLSLSANGYRSLGFTEQQFPQEKETPANSIVRDLPGFPGGGKGAAAKLGDGDLSKDWEEPFRGDVDILIVIADDSSAKATELAQRVTAEARDFSTVVLCQKAHLLRPRIDGTEGRPGPATIEHFGYADGISQPLFFKDEIEAQRTIRHWSDEEPLNLILVPDPHGRDYNSFGSFLVFRKLEQDVRAFRAAEEALGGISDDDGIANADLPGAMMVGRFRNGNPTVTSRGFTGRVIDAAQFTNDFDYSNDPPPDPSEVPDYSSRCPFFAHTRITNPRADIRVVPPAFSHSVRLTRRGVPYQDVSRFGEGKEDLIDPTPTELDTNRPASGVGLLFMSYQAHIGKQFEFIQNNWANHGHIAGRNIGQDGVIGHASTVPSGLPFKPASPDLIPRKLPAQWGVPADAAGPEIIFGGFVKVRGAEYFFTPSISFFELLGE